MFEHVILKTINEEEKKIILRTHFFIKKITLNTAT